MKNTLRTSLVGLALGTILFFPGCNSADMEHATAGLGQWSQPDLAHGRGKMKLMMLGGSSVQQKSANHTPHSGGLALSDAQVRVVEIKFRSASDEQWYAVPISPFELNLLSLGKTVGQVLARIKVPAGFYDELRLVLEGKGTVRVNDVIFPLVVPSGSQSGIKIKFHPPVEVTECALSVGLLELDVQGSFHQAGDKIQFRPSLHVRSTRPLVLEGSGCAPVTPTPGTGDPTPGTGDPTPGTSDPTPGTSDPTPGTSDPTPGTSDPTPGTGDPVIDPPAASDNPGSEPIINPPADSNDDNYLDPFVIGV